MIPKSVILYNIIDNRIVTVLHSAVVSYDGRHALCGWRCGTEGEPGGRSTDAADECKFRGLPLIMAWHILMYMPRISGGHHATHSQDFHE
jgi:hypothetical protein